MASWNKWGNKGLKSITSVLFFCMSFGAGAQENNIRIQSNISPADSVRIIHLLGNASALQNTDPDSLIRLTRLTLAESIQKGFNAGAGRSLGLMATAYRNMGDYATSILLYKQALPFIKKQGKQSEYYIAALYTAMFGAYFPQGMYDSAAINCYKVIELYDGRSPAAINPANSIVNPLIDAYQYLSISWLHLGFYQQALRYSKKAEQLSDSDKHHYQVLSILNNKGAIFLAKNEPDTALAIYEKGLSLMKDFHEPEYIQHMQYLLLGKAASLLQKKAPAKAIPILERILSGNDTVPIFKDTKITAAYSLAAAYYEQGRYDQALALLLPALTKAHTRNLKYNSISPHLTLAQIYKAQGASDKAYEQLRIMQQLSDSLMNNDKVQALNLMDIALQTADKDKVIGRKQMEIAAQQNKIQKKNIWIGAISSSALLLIILLWVLYRSSKHKRHLQEERILSLGKEQEIMRLKAIMSGEEKERTRFARELHDGFISQLSAIKMNFSAMQGRPWTEGMLDTQVQQLEETIQELRKTAHNLIPEILLHRGLAEAVQLYCDRISTAHQLPIDFQFYGTLPDMSKEFELTLYRMIQECIQNIIKHAGASQAIVQINCNESTMGITIEDNGNGIKDEKRKVAGTGLDNLNARIKALSGYLNIYSSKDVGTTIYFEFDTNQPLK